MGSALGGHLYRERRRLVFVASMAFLAGVIMYLHAPVYVGNVHISLVTGSIYALIVGLAALIVCIVLPSMRFMIEAVAVSRLLLSFFVLLVPQVGMQILSSPFITACIVVAGGAAISRLMHGRIVRHGPRWQAPWSPSAMHRVPARVAGNPMQHRLVAWFDDRAPLPA